MNTMKWLLRREFWEHKGAMFWAPLVAAALMFCLFAGSAMYGAAQGGFKSEISVKLSAEGGTERTTSIHTGFDQLPAEKKAEMANVAASGYIAFAAPLFAMLSIVTFFYCLGALHEERRDRSILFWKSLPVSDTQTVVSKVLTAGVVAPLITIAVGAFLSMVTLLVVGTIAAIQGINLIGAVLTNLNFYLAPVQLLALLPVYLVWALPTIGWLLLVSSWAKSKVFLWAVGAPLLAVAMIKWATYVLGAGIQLDWIMENIVARGLVGLVPGNWLPLAHVDKAQMAAQDGSNVLGHVLAASWATLATPQAMFGAAAGAAMIFAAIRIRRWKDEG
jgi:ABC-2 type transport system permease protein